MQLVFKSLILLAFVQLLLEDSHIFFVIFMLYSNLLSVVIESIQQTLYIDMQTMHKLILGGQ